MQRYGSNLIWLALMPLAHYHVETALGGGSVLFRFHPVIKRPRAALHVALAGGGPAVLDRR